MKFLKVFIIISLLIITVYTAAVRPAVHKQFILENAGFKLSNINQQPEDIQSTILFKVGDVVKSGNIVSQTITSEEMKNMTSEIQIIPSSFISSTSGVSSNNTYITNNSTGNNFSNGSLRNESYTNTQTNSDEMLNQVAKMLNTTNDNNTKENNMKNSESSQNNLGCPLCGDLKDPKYRNELIAWNEWRSRIQNRIMDDSEIDAGYGTIFYFMFKVDKDRNIYDIKVICTDFMNPTARMAVKKAISNLRGNPILEFPAGTNRKKVDFNGGFIIGSYAEYSTPGDYNDFENVRMQY